VVPILTDADSPGRIATLVDVARHRKGQQPGEPTASQIIAAWNDLDRIRRKLQKMRSCVQIDMAKNKPNRLLILKGDSAQ
jgi:hypothetical protein